MGYAISLELDHPLVTYLAPLAWLMTPAAENAQTEAIQSLETMMYEEGSSEQQISYCIDLTERLQQM